MKKVIASALVASMLFSSCIGSFGLFTTIKDWNEGVGNKFVNELIFLGFWIIPVYEIALLADLWIINSIEFWSGSNPMAMGEFDREEQLITGKDGNQYLVVATKNQFHIEELGNAENFAIMRYTPEDLKWEVIEGNKHIKLTEGLKDEEGKLTGEVKVNFSKESNMVYNLNEVSLAQLKDQLNGKTALFAKY